MKIELDDIQKILTVNGVRISYELLGALTTPTPPGRWYRTEYAMNGNPPKPTIVVKYQQEEHTK